MSASSSGVSVKASFSRPSSITCCTRLCMAESCRMISIISRISGFCVFSMIVVVCATVSVLELLPLPQCRFQFFNVLSRFLLHIDSSWRRTRECVRHREWTSYSRPAPRTGCASTARRSGPRA